MAARCLRAMFEVNVKDDAGRVACPALVMHLRGDQLIRFEQGRRLASLIPGARFVPLDGENHIPLFGDPSWPHVTEELLQFVGDSAPHETATAHLTPRQQEVLRLVAQGLTDKEVARSLALSPRTVEMHMAGALKAPECATRAEAVARAARQGLLDG